MDLRSLFVCFVTILVTAQHQAMLWIWHEPNYKLDIPQFNAFLGRPPEDRIQIAVADSMEVWRGFVFSPRRLILKKLRCAFRRLFRSPWATAIAIISLGLGIGTNSAIFSTYEALVLRPMSRGNWALSPRDFTRSGKYRCLASLHRP
jgi:hypothetical protein